MMQISHALRSFPRKRESSRNFGLGEFNLDPRLSRGERKKGNRA
jgi:hypothetical protein